MPLHKMVQLCVCMALRLVGMGSFPPSIPRFLCACLMLRASFVLLCACRLAASSSVLLDQFLELLIWGAGALPHLVCTVTCKAPKAARYIDALPFLLAEIHSAKAPAPSSSLSLPLPLPLPFLRWPDMGHNKCGQADPYLRHSYRTIVIVCYWYLV